jgi:phage terminase large subunit-like protein
MVYDDLDAFIQAMDYDVLSFGYDPYNAQAFVDRWCREHTSFGVEKVIQGSRTESVPLGELKNLARDKLLWFDEELMSFSMGNAITIEDTNGNRKLLKRRYDEKIDNVSALMDAFVAYKIHKELFE